MVAVRAFIARGDTPTDVLPAAIPSPIVEATAEAWQAFVRAMATQPIHAETEAGLGCFALRPKMLGDLGLMANLRPVQGKRQGRSGDRVLWEGDFVLPLTKDRFLGSYLAQYNAFVRAVTLHANAAAKLPAGVTTSGAHAILIQAGPWGLRSWARGTRHEGTIELFNRANGIF